MDDLPGFQRDLLYVIADANFPSGQTIKEEIEAHFSSKLIIGDHIQISTYSSTKSSSSELSQRINDRALTDAGEEAIHVRRE